LQMLLLAVQAPACPAQLLLVSDGLVTQNTLLFDKSLNTPALLLTSEAAVHPTASRAAWSA
jgi:hypothetical protein